MKLILIFRYLHRKVKKECNFSVQTNTLAYEMGNSRQFKSTRSVSPV
jgi:hypothetical protein